MMLLAGFQALLHGYTGQEDMVIGALIANRGRVDVENLIGYFVNTIAIRTDLSGDPTFLDLLGRVRDAAIDAYENKDLPFDLVWRALRENEPELKQRPLFPFLFSVHTQPISSMELASLDIKPLVSDAEHEDVEIIPTTFSLVVDAIDESDAVTLIMKYSLDAFEAETIETILTRFHSMLDQCVLRPDARLSQLWRLVATEQAQD
jgi:non-ribosomal peptide synthetase component F